MSEITIKTKQHISKKRGQGEHTISQWIMKKHTITNSIIKTNSQMGYHKVMHTNNIGTHQSFRRALLKNTWTADMDCVKGSNEIELSTYWVYTWFYQLHECQVALYVILLHFESITKVSIFIWSAERDTCVWSEVWFRPWKCCAYPVRSTHCRRASHIYAGVP